MNTTLLWIALGIALLDWIAVGKQWKGLEFFAKPGVMLLMLVWLWSLGGFSGQMTWFAIGLGLSLCGDIFLMLPREQFLAGLAAFLGAHVAYLIGFNPTLPPVNPVSLALAIMVGLTAARLYRAIAIGLATSGNRKLHVPVLIYSTVISLMLLSALLSLARQEWGPIPALMVSFGAMLFFLSDGILAWNKFVRPLRYGKLVTIITYHLGQVLIATGAAGHFLAAG